MLYCFWDIAHDGCNYFSFWPIFCPFTPLTAWKIKIKKKKKSVEISSFCTSAPKIMITCYTVLEIWHVTDVIVIFYFGLFLALSPPSTKNQTAQKIKIFKKMNKTSGDIIILHTCTKNYDQMMYGSWDMVHNRQMDRQKDRKSDI